jgi:hypothetical protein
LTALDKRAAAGARELGAGAQERAQALAEAMMGAQDCGCFCASCPWAPCMFMCA